MGTLPTETYATTITRTRQYEITSTDDDADIYGQNADYATARTTATNGEWGDWFGVGQKFGSSQYTVYRGFLRFDTSRIPDTATILSAKLCLYGDWDQSTTDFVIRIQKWTGNTPINTGDYNQFDGVNYDDGNYNTANFDDWAWNNITITNFSIINVAGDTLICLRSSRDINADTPTGVEFVQFFTKDWLGDKPAFLEITYSFPVPEYTVIPNWMVGGENGYLMAADLPSFPNYTGYVDGFETGARASFWQGTQEYLNVTSDTTFVKSGIYGAKSSEQGSDTWYYSYPTQQSGNKFYTVAYKIVPNPNDPNITSAEYLLGSQLTYNTTSSVDVALYLLENATGVFLQLEVSDGVNDQIVNGTHILSLSTWYTIKLAVTASTTQVSASVYVDGGLDSTATISYTYTGIYYEHFEISPPSFNWQTDHYTCLSAIDNFAENQDITFPSPEVNDLSDVLATDFDIGAIRNGYGFYLLGLEDEPLGTYEGPAAGARIVDYHGETFTNVAPSVQGVQIMDIARYRSKFLIGGYYASTGGSYAYGRLYTYDGQTFTDVTEQILGSNFGPAVTALADCEGYWLIGTKNTEQDFGYIYKWDGYTLTEIMNVYEELGTGVYPTEIEWNGEYALIGFSYGSSYAPIYKYNGTFTDLSSEASFPAMSGIGEISWNGTVFLVSSKWYQTTSYTVYTKIYNGTTFTNIDELEGIIWNTIEWNGNYWMLGGKSETANKLIAYRDDLIDYSPLIWFEPTSLCPGALIVYVTSDPEVNAHFQFQGKTYTTPAVVVCYYGSYFVAVVDLFKEINETKLAFTHMIYSASPAIEIYSASATLQVTNDGNLTLVYFTGAPKKEPPPTPVPEEEEYCLPLTFYIIMVALAFLALYLFSQRETWKISVPLLPIALWLLIFQPKTPIDQMPLAFLRYFTVPPWHLYMAVILTIIACVALLSKKEK
jgi:hypothetical protein